MDKAVIDKAQARELRAREDHMARLQSDLTKLEEENSQIEKKDVFQVVKFSAVRNHATKMRERAAAAAKERAACAKARAPCATRRASRLLMLEQHPPSPAVARAQAWREC